MENPPYPNEAIRPRGKAQPDFEAVPTTRKAPGAPVPGPPAFVPAPPPYAAAPASPGANRTGRVPDDRLASWGTRVAGALIDVGVPTIAFWILTSVATAASLALGVAVSLLGTLALIGFIVWNSGFRQGITGQSLGKEILGTRLVDARTGEPIGFGMAVGRHLAHVVDALPLYLGYLWPLWDEQRQTFADKLVGTLVVRTDG